MGAEAQPVQGVVRLRQPINEAWRAMFQQLLTSGQLEEAADGGLMRGRHFSVEGLQPNSADAQRTSFVINTVRQIDIGRLKEATVQEDNVIWAEFGYG
jgi:hypothetical protein